MIFEEIELLIVKSAKLNAIYEMDNSGIWLKNYDDDTKMLVVHYDVLVELTDRELFRLMEIIIRLNDGKLVLL